MGFHKPLLRETLFLGGGVRDPGGVGLLDLGIPLKPFGLELPPLITLWFREKLLAYLF